jgi:hypothetical protein
MAAKSLPSLKKNNMKKELQKRFAALQYHAAMLILLLGSASLS